jgi:hypothetical protein
MDEVPLLGARRGAWRVIHILYRTYDHDGQLLYVGITNNPMGRFRSHEVTKDWWPNVAEIKLATFESRDDLVAAEREAILTEKPLHNVVHNPSRPRTTGLTQERTYSLTEVAEAWGLTGDMKEPERWIMRQIRSGRFPARKVGSRWRMTEQEMETAQEACSNKAYQQPPEPPQLTVIDGGGLSAGSRRRRGMA